LGKLSLQVAPDTVFIVVDNTVRCYLSYY